MTSLQLDLLAPRWSPEVIAQNAITSGKLAYSDPFSRMIAGRLKKAAGDRLTFDEAEWDHGATDAVGIDVEVYRNFFLVCFKRFSDGRRLAFEMSERSLLNVRGIDYVMRKNLTVSFNGFEYDLPILKLALAGADLRAIKATSDAIVRESGRRGPPSFDRTWDHVDLIECNPSIRQGLKMLNARLHGRYLVDLPYDPDAILSADEMNVVTLYCHNDLDATHLLWDAMREPMRLRTDLGREYGLDFRSRSDAQIGEAIVKRKIEGAVGRRLPRPTAPSISSFGYEPPEWIEFKTVTLDAVRRKLSALTFQVRADGKIETPEYLRELLVPIGKQVYSMGIGGLHSTEAHRALRSTERELLIDVDVASQYPNIIMKLGLYPAALGPTFLRVYGAIIAERLAAKARLAEIEKELALGETPELLVERERMKVRTEGLKISINGVYGKLGSPYSLLYAPHLLIAVTLTGQLSILMLIESAEAAGIPVVSANTDGVVFHVPRERMPVLDELLATWEMATGFQTERNPYQAIYNASVNSYIAVKASGKAKRKGPISDPWSEADLREQMKKNPQMTILSEAVLRYVTEGTAFERTIASCVDPRMFVSVIKVTGGAVWRGHELGRVVRYYWSTDGEPIRYRNNGNKVSRTDGARPLPELTAELPPAIDYLRYCEEAAKLARELGLTDLAHG